MAMMVVPSSPSPVIAEASITPTTGSALSSVGVNGEDEEGEEEEVGGGRSREAWVRDSRSSIRIEKNSGWSARMEMGLSASPLLERKEESEEELFGEDVEELKDAEGVDEDLWLRESEGNRGKEVDDDDDPDADGVFGGDEEEGETGGEYLSADVGMTGSNGDAMDNWCFELEDEEDFDFFDFEDFFLCFFLRLCCSFCLSQEV